MNFKNSALIKKCSSNNFPSSAVTTKNIQKLISKNLAVINQHKLTYQNFNSKEKNNFQNFEIMSKNIHR